MTFDEMRQTGWFAVASCLRFGGLVYEFYL